MGELHNLNMRGGADYTEGHCRMYTPIAEILGNCPANILEIGFGIGYGLKKLLESNCVGNYLGIESDKECVDYVSNKGSYGLTTNAKMLLACKDWTKIDDEFVRKHFGGQADFVLCIEVVEHVAGPVRSEMVKKALTHTGKTMFLSSPNSETSGHGVMSVAECRAFILSCGFNSVAHIEWQWTTMYVCNP